ncbi:MAG: hypothetical protein SFU27_14200 [Thermonemataceae bacterium]|nr:hypothetical protein [Thermonemataceae bacterium]
MKKIIVLLFFYGINITFAQSTKVYPDFYEIFICKNPNGSTETLLATFDTEGKRGFIYKNSKNPDKEIPLTIVSNDNDETFVVNFPNDKKSYTLKTCIACPEIVCNNPDGSVQTFSLNYDFWGNRGSYRCINPDGTTEYLHIEGSARDLKVKYSSSTRPSKWINLEVSNVNVSDMDNLNFFDVKFPYDTKNYRIEANPTGYGYNCWLPNGGIQVFNWINK